MSRPQKQNYAQFGTHGSKQGPQDLEPQKGAARIEETPEGKTL